VPLLPLERSGSHRSFTRQKETFLGAPPHDGVFTGKRQDLRSSVEPDQTLVVCRLRLPAIRLLSSEPFERLSGFRLLTSRDQAAKLLSFFGSAWFHVAGVHLADPESRGGNARIVQNAFGCRVLPPSARTLAGGLALDPTLKINSCAKRSSPICAGLAGRRVRARGVVSTAFSWKVGPQKPSSYTANSHLAVVEAIKERLGSSRRVSRLFALEARLSFLNVEREDYDLCYPVELEGDPSSWRL